MSYLVHGCVVGPWQCDHPGPGLAVHPGGHRLQLVGPRAADRGQVAALLQPPQGVGGGAEAQLVVLVQRGRAAATAAAVSLLVRRRRVRTGSCRRT